MKQNYAQVVSVCLLYGHFLFPMYQPVRQPWLVIVNESSWPASVFWVVSGPVPGAHVLKSFNAVISASEQENIGPLRSIEKLEIRTYGDTYSRIFKKHDIALDTLKSETARGAILHDCYITIQLMEGYLFRSWNFVHERRNMNLLRAVDLPAYNEIWRAFPGVMRARCAGRPIKAHHILNIDPNYATGEIVDNAFTRLQERWDMGRFGLQLVASKIQVILTAAYKSIQKELINGAERVERQTFNPDTLEFSDN